ncbi:putative pre-rRNA-processing protein TSR2 [Helianthus annuus]|nr:putative pre-rRNA-processing protein TSR2 [Helianthus annuus]
MAIQNEWGGRDTRQRAQQLTLDIYQWLIRPSEGLYVDELEDLLDDFMLSLNTEIDDGSIEEIAENLMIMHEECLEGNFASIGRLRQSVPTSNQQIQVVKVVKMIQILHQAQGMMNQWRMQMKMKMKVKMTLHHRIQCSTEGGCRWLDRSFSRRNRGGRP